MKPTDLIRVEKLRDRTHCATLGDFAANAPTKLGAQVALLAAIRDEARLDTSPVALCAPGMQSAAWVFWRAAQSWCYRMPSGSVTICSGDRRRALDMFTSHFDQYYGIPASSATVAE